MSQRRYHLLPSQALPQTERTKAPATTNEMKTKMLPGLCACAYVACETKLRLTKSCGRNRMSLRAPLHAHHDRSPYSWIRRLTNVWARVTHRNPSDIGNFVEDCQEVKRKVQCWGVMQQKKRQSLEARMRDLRLMSTMRKPDRLELSQLVSNLRGGAQTFRDTRSLPVGSSMMQMSLSPKGRAVHEHGQHRHEMERNARSWAHAGRFQGMDTAHAHAGDNMTTHKSYTNGSSLGGGTGVADFSPLARRQRCTTQRLQEKNAMQTQTPTARGGYQPTGGGFGAHKPVGPQCKFLPIMLGSLRGTDSSSEL